MATTESPLSIRQQLDDPVLGAANRRSCLVRYLQLLKLNVPELALYSFAAVAVVPASSWRLIRIESLFLLFTFCCTTLTNVLDDISGYVDGVDRLNVTMAKKNIVKPLLTGEVTLAGAWWAAGVISVCALSAAGALSAQSGHPLATFAALIALLLVVTQYSFGLKLSYRAMGELVIIYGVAATVLIPFSIVTDAMPPLQVWWLATMLGLPYAAQIVCSNAVDHDGDKAAGRRTLTVIVGPERAPWLSLLYFVIFWLGFVVGVHERMLPRSTWIWLPLLLGHLRYLQLFWARQYIHARLLSFRLIRAQLVLVPFSLMMAR